MKLLYLPKFLRALSPFTMGRWFAFVFIIGAFGLAISFVGKAVDVVSDGPKVNLVLNNYAAEQYSAANGAAQRQNALPSKPTSWSPVAPQLNANGFELSPDPQTLIVRYNEQNPWKRLALFFLGASKEEVLSLAAVLYFVLGSKLLWQLLLDVTPETPFTSLNARRLRKLALLVLVLFLIKHPARYAVQALVPAFHASGLAKPLSHYVRLNTENTLPGVEVGIMLAVIAAVYRRGVELSREAELVI